MVDAFNPVKTVTRPTQANADNKDQIHVQLHQELPDAVGELRTGLSLAITQMNTELAGKVASSGFTEAAQDATAAMFRAGSNVTISYDDAANTFTINAVATGGTSDPEAIRDTIGGALVGGTGVQVTVDDAADTITLSVAGIPASAITTGILTPARLGSGTPTSSTVLTGDGAWTAGFVKSSDLTQATDLVTTSSLSSTLTNYAQTSALSSYATTAALGGKADNTALTNALSRIAALEASGNITPSQRGTTPATTAPAIWLRADQISGVADGAAVSSWPAAAGTAATTNTGNSGTSPLYVAAATSIKSQPAVRFNSSTRSKMVTPATGVGTARNVTYFLVVNLRSLSAIASILTGINSSEAGVTMGTRLQVTTAGALSAQQFASNGGTPSVTAAGSIPVNAWVILSVVYASTANGATPTGYVNGIAGSGGVGDASTAAVAATNLALGGYGTSSADMDYAEVVAIPSALSDTDRKLWESYLSKVYGITVAA